MKKDPPVLVILTPGFPENEQDTECLPFAQSLILALNKDFSFLKIIIVSFQYPFTSVEYKWHGNKAISFGGKNKGKLLRRLLWIKVWKRLQQIRNNNNVIGLFSFWLGECALLGNRFGNKYGIPHRCWIAGQDAGPNNKYVYKINPVAKELVAISDFVANEFFKNYLMKPLHIIPNGIAPELFQHTSLERTVDVLGAGSLIPLKRYELFIDCIAEVKKKLPDIYTVIAGKGPEEFSLSKNIIERKLQNNIVFNGEMKHVSLLRLMQQSKVFLHPSSYEGFSMVCLEALYAGCQVISFCKPMNIDFKNWHIVNTEEEAVNKTYEILSQKDLEYEPVLLYSIDDTAKSVMELFGY